MTINFFCESQFIYEYDEDSEEFLLRATDHIEEELINALHANSPRLGDGVVGRAAISRQPVPIPDILEERAYAPRMRELLARFGFRARAKALPSALPYLRDHHRQANFNREDNDTNHPPLGRTLVCEKLLSAQ